MRLHAHRVDAATMRLQVFDQSHHGLALARGIHPIIVVIQFHVGVGLMGELECQADEIRPDDAIERRLAQLAIALDGLVHHVPAFHAAFVVSHDFINMVFHALDEHIAAHLVAQLVLEEPTRGL